MTGIVLETDSQNVFTLTYNTGGSYTIALSADATRTMGSYTYTARATADGGATETVTQTFTVTRECMSYEASVIDKIKAVNIPASSSVEEIIYYASSDFVDAPTADDGYNGPCTQTFAIQNYDGNDRGTSLSPGLAIDASTGEVTVTKFSSSEDAYNY